MKKETARGLAECGNVRVYEDYSGRGMFGATTHGVVGSHTDLYNAVEAYLKQEGQHEIHPEDFIDQFRSDSLGLEFIWY